jgi:hypothetical protein
MLDECRTLFDLAQQADRGVSYIVRAQRRQLTEAKSLAAGLQLRVSETCIQTSDSKSDYESGVRESSSRNNPHEQSLTV